jgi:hypothetical protein
LINAQISHEIAWRAESKVLDEKMKDLIDSQKEIGEFIKGLGIKHDKEVTDLRESQQETDKALRAFIKSLTKEENGKFSS